MALSIVFAKSDIDKQAESITFKDTTGAYNVTTNPTGYGVDNDFLTPTIAFLIWKYWTDTAEKQMYLVPDDVTDLLATGGLAVTPIGPGYTGDAFSDGIHQVQYVPLNDSGVNGTFTNGSKIVILSTTSWDPGAIDSALVAYVAGINSSDTTDNKTDVLEVDWTATNDTTQIVLKEAYDGDTVTARLWFGPLAEIKVLVNKAAEACLVEMIGKLSLLDCECQAEVNLLNKLTQWRFAADVQFDCDDFDGAHNLVVQIGRYCTSGNCLIC